MKQKKNIDVSMISKNNFNSSLQVKIFNSVDENLSFIKKQLGDSIGLGEGKFKAFGGQFEIGILYITSLCNKEFISDQVIAPLLCGTLKNNMENIDISVLSQTVFISSINTKIINLKEEAVTELLKGNTVVFFEGSSNILIVQAPKMEKRSIEKPENETTIFSAKEAFVEDIETNMSMIIRRLPIPALKFETHTLGKLSRTNSKLLWVQGLAKDDIIAEARRRIKDVDTDIVDSAGNLAELIQDKPAGIFPSYRLTERPDMVSRALSNGHIAILCNNSPFALVVPMTFWDNFKTMDDYSQIPFASSFLRITRILAFIVSVIISPLYLAFVTYNHTIVPPSLALNISQGREGVPFPSIIELIAMTIIIDIIREAGTRMPGMVGYFIGTLGAVIIGQSAVEAGYVSVSLIIVLAFSAIATFAISSSKLVNTSRIINYFLIFLSGFLGIFGFFNGCFIILWRMSIQESFGVPYLYPIIPVEFQGWKDTFIRAPFKMLKSKLTLIAKQSSNKSGDQNK